ncbi:MAG: DUF3747 domain-containing protein [Cyanobacteria bacterium J06639_1]
MMRRTIARYLMPAFIALAGAIAPTPARSVEFEAQAVDPSRFILVAASRNLNDHQFIILEQISDQQACWMESGEAPTAVDPLLLNFDFTGICGRSIDSNGYSIRVDGRDLALDYSLRVVRQGNQLILVAGSNNDFGADLIPLGRSYGISPSGYTKILLDPGWRLARRTYQDTLLGHIYITTDEITN